MLCVSSCPCCRCTERAERARFMLCVSSRRCSRCSRRHDCSEQEERTIQPSDLQYEVWWLGASAAFSCRAAVVSHDAQRWRGPQQSLVRWRRWQCLLQSLRRWFGALHDRDCGLQTSQPRLQVLESVLPTTERQLQFAQSEGFVGMHLCLFLPGDGTHR